MKRWLITALLVALGCGATASFFVLRPQQAAAPSAAARTADAAPRGNAEHKSQVALVIGNGAYPDAALDNPVNDSRLVAAALREFGFYVVERQNLSQNEMRQAIREFGDALQKRGDAVFYFAGHGVQFRGRNYLIPVSADIRHEDEIEDQAVDVNLVLAKMDSAKSHFNLVILDACRNNPFTKGFTASSAGLAPMDAPTGTLVAFATAPGQVAEDGSGGNGLYTRHLVENMRRPGVSVEEVFKRTRTAVRTDSQGHQVPWENTSLEENFSFVPATAVASRDEPAAPREAPVREAADPGAARPAIVAEPPPRPPADPPKSTKMKDAQVAVEPPAKQSVQAPAAAPPQNAQIAMAAPQTSARAVARDAATDEVVAAYRRQDYALAFRLATPLAERGNAIAQYHLAEMYRLGHGTEANAIDALKWYRRAGEQGNLGAQEWIGRSYLAGLGVPRDYTEALKWFKRAADQGSAAAQNALGNMYRNGQGVQQSTAEAAHWYELSAAGGNPEAQYNLQITRAQAAARQ